MEDMKKKIDSVIKDLDLIITEKKWIIKHNTKEFNNSIHGVRNRVMLGWLECTLMELEITSKQMGDPLIWTSENKIETKL